VGKRTSFFCEEIRRPGGFRLERTDMSVWIVLPLLLAASACVSEAVVPTASAEAPTPGGIPAATLSPSSSASATVEPTPTPSVEPTPFVFRQLVVSDPELGLLNTLVFSPDGSWLAAGGSDDAQTHGTVLLWNMEELRHIGDSRRYGFPTRSSERRITSLAFSFDGRMLAAGSNDGDVYFWDASSPRDESSPVRVFPKSENGLNPAYQDRNLAQASLVAASSRDATLAIAYDPFSDTGGIVLQDIFSGELLVSMSARYVTHMDFSPDGALLAVGTSMGKVALWGVSSGRGARDYKMEEMESAGISEVAFSPDGSTLAVLLINGRVYLLNTYKAEAIWWMDCGLYAGGDILFMPDGGKLLVGLVSSLFIIDVGSREYSVRETSIGRIAALALSPDGKTLAIGGSNGTIELWNAEEFLPAPV
jgi:WD40 repeat protein